MKLIFQNARTPTWLDKSLEFQPTTEAMLKIRLLERLIASTLLFEEEEAPIETLAKVSDGSITNQDLYVTTSFAELQALIMN